ncbi:MAG: LysM peptidoglycan-binding domain-containing protein [Bacteroidia bacterium]
MRGQIFQGREDRVQRMQDRRVLMGESSQQIAQPMIQRQPDEGIVDKGPTEHAKGTFDANTNTYTFPDDKTKETLYSIAVRFGTSVDALKNENGLTGNNLSKKKTLTIPGGKVQQSEVPVITPEQKKAEENDIKKRNEETAVSGVNYSNKGFEYNEGLWYAFDYYDRTKSDDDFKSRWQDSWWNGYTDSDKWTKLPNEMTFTVKDKIKASDAIQEWLKGLTITECYSVLVAVQMDAIRKEIGDKNFDIQYSNFYGPAKNGLLTISSDSDKDKQWDSVVKFRDIDPTNFTAQPGEWGYIYNHPKYLLKHPAGVFQGENVVYMGDDNWSGFGMSPQNLKTGPRDNSILNSMASSYNDPRTSRDYWKILTIMTDNNLKDSGGVPEIVWDNRGTKTSDFNPSMEGQYQQIYEKYRKKKLVPKEYNEEYVHGTKNGKKNKKTVDSDYFIPRHITAQDILDADEYTLPFDQGGNGKPPTPRKGGLQDYLKGPDPEKVNNMKNN